MREGLKLSTSVFLLGLLILVQMLTQLRLDFLMLLMLAVGATWWCEGQIKWQKLRLVQLILLTGGLWYAVNTVMPLLMPSHSLGSLSAAWLIMDRIGLGATGVYAFLTEVYDYAVLPDKLDFYHWEMLSLLFLLVNAELVYWLNRFKMSGPVFILGAILSGLLWFTYLDVWALFICCFVAYATERLTRQGKGALFGLVLPLGITVSALFMTNLTPINAINEALTPLTAENSWLRTALNLSPGTGAFGLKEMGFYPLEDRLGGPVKLSKEIFFRVRSATPSIYLRGHGLTTYADSRWLAEESEPQVFDTVSKQKSNQIEYFIYDFKSRTNSVMVPMSVSQIDIPQEKLSFGPERAVIYSGNVKAELKDGFNVTGYNTSYVQPTPTEKYLQLPENYSPKVVALTQQIIKGAKSDEEKVKRIRKYLLNNYTYALAVAVPPKEQDFVEYFLTEADSGYCVYFATATAVMSRIAGLPSRYVEGFVTPELFEAGRDAAVSGERAHAWAEVFYDRAWHIVETTPTFTSLTEFDQQDAQLKSDLLEPEKDPAKGKTEQDLDPETLPEADVNANQTTMPLWILLFPALLVAVALLIVLKFRAFFNGTPRQMKDKYVQLLLLGLCQHFALRTPERLTPRDILMQCDQYAPSLKLRTLVEIVEQSLYDSSDISEEAMVQLAGAYWQLFHGHFKWSMKLYWCAKIVGKGRIFNGNDGKNSAT